MRKNFSFKFKPGDYAYMSYPQGIKKYKITQIKFDGVQNQYLIPKLGHKWVSENDLYESLTELVNNISLIYDEENERNRETL